MVVDNVIAVVRLFRVAVAAGEGAFHRRCRIAAAGDFVIARVMALFLHLFKYRNAKNGI